MKYNGMRPLRPFRITAEYHIVAAKQSVRVGDAHVIVDAYLVQLDAHALGVSILLMMEVVSAIV